MAVNQNDIYVGMPEQSTTGAIHMGATTLTAPTSAISELPSGYDASGYVNEDGLELTTDLSTTKIKDWSGSVVRELLDEFSGEITWNEMEFSETSLKHAFGESNVTVTPATATTHKQIKTAIKGEMPPQKSWVFDMKDGDKRMRIYVPNGQVKSSGTYSFKSNEVVVIPITLATYPDASGNSIYIFTDDGKVASA